MIELTDEGLVFTVATNKRRALELIECISWYLVMHGWHLEGTCESWEGATNAQKADIVDRYLRQYIADLVKQGRYMAARMTAEASIQDEVEGLRAVLQE